MKALLLILLSVFTLDATCSAQQVKVVLSANIQNTSSEENPAESNTAIMKAKAEHPDLGSTVYIYLHNKSKNLVKVKNIIWDGSDIKTRQQAPDYQVIWWRCSPGSIAPGQESEITINLRESLKKDTVFQIEFQEAEAVKCTVKPATPRIQLSTVAFAPDLSTAYLYVDVPKGQAPTNIYINGQAARSAKALGRAANGLALYRVNLATAYKKGARYLFRLMIGSEGCAGSLRALPDLARFGTYGYAYPEKYAAGGLDSYASFAALDAKSLAQHSALGMKAAMIIGTKPPDPSVIGNPGLYAYVPMDEPDCHDYSVEDRPMHKRIGAYAQELVDWADNCERIDSLTPTKVTIDLTFAPQNYFVYAKVNDIANPDCYTVSLGWPLSAFRDKAATVKRASAPQPYTMTYQGNWEEWVKKQESWVSPTQIEQIGSENLIDRTKLRGFGRAPSPEEIRIPMLYAVGSGARGLFCYIASTEAYGELMTHSAVAMPELWQEVTSTSRDLRLIAPLLQLSHPSIWAKSDRSGLWTRTLLCGDNAALIVAVNEECKSERAGFTTAPISGAKFSFTDLPWLTASRVYRVAGQKLLQVKADKIGKTLSWNSANIKDGEIYLVCSDNKLPVKLEKEYAAKSTHITRKGLELGQEGHLKGRRTTPQD